MTKKTVIYVVLTIALNFFVILILQNYNEYTMYSYIVGSFVGGFIQFYYNMIN